MDIEIIEDSKEIISEQSIKSWINEPCFRELTSITNKAFIKDKETYIDNKKLVDEVLSYVIKRVYEHGYYKGLRERGDKNEGRKFPINNWDSEKVYPKGSVID